MNTLELVDPDLRPFLEAVAFPTMSPKRVAERRAMLLPVGPDLDGVVFEERIVQGWAGAPDIRLVVYRPTAAEEATAAILHIHGGGYVVGSPEMSDAENRSLCHDLQCVVVSVDYRLAPETPFPGPLEDCYAALCWLTEHAGELNVDPRRIAVKGESAGGGLAAGLALLVRDRREVQLAFQCLTYPMIDDRQAVERHPFTGEFVWTRDSNWFGWASYLGREPGSPDVSPYAAPARAGNLTGLAPAIILTGALDLFLEENLEYARQLTRAGVAVDLITYRGAYHGFQMAGDTRVTQRYRRDVREALGAALQISLPVSDAP